MQPVRVPRLRCPACCRPSGLWITFDRISTIFAASVPHCSLCCTHCFIPESLLNHPHSYCEGMFKLNAKFDAHSLLCLLSYFECGSHTVHTLTQWCLPIPSTSTVNSSLFIQAHSSPLSLAARLHQCRTNRSHNINSGWTFPDRPSYRDTAVRGWRGSQNSVASLRLQIPLCLLPLTPHWPAHWRGAQSPTLGVPGSG